MERSYLLTVAAVGEEGTDGRCCRSVAVVCPSLRWHVVDEPYAVKLLLLLRLLQQTHTRRRAGRHPDTADSCRIRLPHIAPCVLGPETAAARAGFSSGRVCSTRRH